MFLPVFLVVALLVINPTSGSETLFQSLDTLCTVKHGRRLLNEGDRIVIQGKNYKIEDCQLQRSYQACGSYLWFMINIVCNAIESKKGKNIDKNRFRRLEREKLLTAACCENSCTISEMTRYCAGQGQ